MRELASSLFSYSIAVSLFSVQQLGKVLSRDEESAAGAFRSATKAAVDQFGGTLVSTFRALDHAQRGVIGWGFSLVTPRQE